MKKEGFIEMLKHLKTIPKEDQVLKNLEGTGIGNAVAYALVHGSADTLWEATVSQRGRVCPVLYYHFVNRFVDFVCRCAWLPIIKFIII